MTAAQDLIEALGGKWHGTFGTARCPVHDDKSPSLSIRDGDKAPLLKCFSGCDARTIVDVLKRRRLWPDSNKQRLEIGIHTSSPQAFADRNRECAIKIWGESIPLERSSGAKYLAARGITVRAPLSLRLHRGLKHAPTGLIFPALVAAIQAPNGSIVAVQRTFLITDYTRKANVSEPRMTLGAMGAGAVRLAPGGGTLGIAEGIETGLSAMQMFGLPVWCSLGAERLGKIVLPSIVNRVVIFGDIGAEIQVRKASAVYTDQGREVEVQYPEIGKDFNDQLRETVKK